MLDDLTKEIKAQLYERVKSPLFGAFAFSWVGWNYRPILAVLSGMTFPEKLAYFDSIYPSGWHWVGYCFGGPLLTAVVFLLAYPHPARWMYRYWAGQHKELKKVQQEIEDETPLTQEEARALRKASLAQVSGLEAEIRDQRQLIDELNVRLREVAQENNRLAMERDVHQQAAKKAQEELAPHLAAVTSQSLPDAFSGARPVGYPDADALFQGRKTDVLKDISESESERESSTAVFNAMARLGNGTTEDVATVAGLHPIMAHQSLLGFVKTGMVTRDGDVWELTNKGKDAAKPYRVFG